jgi:hypothetical protein
MLLTILTKARNMALSWARLIQVILGYIILKLNSASKLSNKRFLTFSIRPYYSRRMLYYEQQRSK